MKTCQKCGAERPALHTHHVVPRVRGGTDASDNLLKLCANCHVDAHKDECGGALARHTPETGQLISRAIKLRFSGQGYRERHSEAMKGAAQVRDRAEWSEKLKATWTDERRQRHGELVREAKLHPEKIVWAVGFDACVSCGSTAIRHASCGKCLNCYYRDRRRQQRAESPRKHRTRTGVCDKCKEILPLHRHHIVPRSKGGTDDPSNIRQLCGNCHEDEHDGPFGRNLLKDPEIQERRKAGVARKWADLEWKEQHLGEMREALKTVDHKAKGRKASAAWTPEKRAAHAERIRAIKRAAGVTASDEQRKQISETLKAKHAAGVIASPMKGKVTPDEVRQKQSEARKRYLAGIRGPVCV